MYRYEMHYKHPNVLERVIESVRYYKYATRILKKRKYDFVILWREYAVFLFSQFVFHHYKGRYSVNIRDLWSKRNIPVTIGVKKAVKGSAFNTVCSDGFIPHLPPADYLFLQCINHDASKKLRELVTSIPEHNKHEGPINIVYIGTLRFKEYCCRLTDVFGNDNRFCVKFIGQGSEEIEKYAKKKGYSNVMCKGAFPPEETAELLIGADIINCAYGTASDAERTLIPTRFYYAVDMNCLVLTTEGTWVQKKANDLKIGISIPSSISGNYQSIANKVYDDYIALTANRDLKLLQNCRDEIEKTNAMFEKKFLECLQ